MKALLRKIVNVFLTSNRWKHFLFAVPAGMINVWLGVGLALGMEFKDCQYGGDFDLVDATFTVLGAWLGASLAWRIFGDYVLNFLFGLIW